MPRSAEEILAHADELARRFEDYEPGPGELLDATELRHIADAFARRADAERGLGEASAPPATAGTPGPPLARCSAHQAKPPASGTATPAIGTPTADAPAHETSDA
jgi:hypothetical protein